MLSTVGVKTPKAGAGSSEGKEYSSPQRKKSQISPDAAGFADGLGGPLDNKWLGNTSSVTEINKETVKKGFTARQWTTLIIFGLADLFSAMISGLQAPFYPPEVIIQLTWL
jgi:hypothetical protein